MEKEEKTLVNLDSVIENLGSNGKYNVLNLSLIIFAILLSGIYECIYIFESPLQQFRCRIPECESTNIDEWRAYALPNLTQSSCLRYSYTNATPATPGACSSNNFDTSHIVECRDVVYEGDNSAVKDFDLGCEDWKRTLIGTVHNSGYLISLLLAGTLSDRYGRRIALSLSFLALFIFGFGRSFTSSYFSYLLMNFLEAALGGGAYSTSFVFAIEIVSAKQRVMSNSIFSISFVTGVISLAGIAYWVENWRTMLQIVFGPGIIVSGYVLFMNESARWLMSKGKRDEAIEVLKKAAKMNGIPVESLDLNRLTNPLISSKKIDDNKKGEFKMALYSPIIWKRVFASSFLWVTCTLVYYGMSINAVSLSGNKYVNFVLVMLVEIPANFVVILLLNKFGRKKTIIFNFISSGVLCLMFAFMPQAHAIWSLILYLFGKFGITLTYSSVYIYVSEVFPTSLRQTLIGLCSTVGRIGSMLAPMTPLLKNYHSSLPSILFGVMCVLSSSIVFLLPETINTRLPDTVEQAETMNKIDEIES